jgi:uridine phosphorylase
VASSPIHLKPQTDLAERVLLPGDPHRALAIAQDLLTKPLMFNHHRGLWGYTGLAADGEPLTVQSTGMGGPSAAIVVEELIGLGARVLLRTGTCGALDADLAIGDVVAARSVIPADGTSRALGASGSVEPDERLLAALVEAGARAVTVRSADLFYGDEGEGGDVVEMEAATVLQIARNHGLRAACVLGVSDVLAGDERHRICAEHLEALGVQLGQAAYAALATR